MEHWLKIGKINFTRNKFQEFAVHIQLAFWQIIQVSFMFQSSNIFSLIASLDKIAECSLTRYDSCHKRITEIFLKNVNPEFAQNRKNQNNMQISKRQLVVLLRTSYQQFSTDSQRFLNFSVTFSYSGNFPCGQIPAQNDQTSVSIPIESVRKPVSKVYRQQQPPEVLLKFSQNSQENTFARVSFLIKLQA